MQCSCNSKVATNAIYSGVFYNLIGKLFGYSFQKHTHTQTMNVKLISNWQEILEN